MQTQGGRQTDKDRRMNKQAGTDRYIERHRHTEKRQRKRRRKEKEREKETDRQKERQLVDRQVCSSGIYTGVWRMHTVYFRWSHQNSRRSCWGTGCTRGCSDTDRYLTGVAGCEISTRTRCGGTRRLTSPCASWSEALCERYCNLRCESEWLDRKQATGIRSYEKINWQVTQ